MSTIAGKKKLILAIVLSAFVILGIISVAIILNKHKSTEKNDSIVSASENVQEQSDNVFVVKTKKIKKNRIKIIVSLEQIVNLCNFKIGLRYDNQALKLLDYDNELSVYSPTVNPEKDGNEIQWERGANDIIKMTWASAKNCTTSGDIISMEFEVLDKHEGSIPVTLTVEEIGMLDETYTVVKPDYKIDYYEE